MGPRNIGIVILATNAYFVLGVHFIKKFLHHYKGGAKITFYFFSDTDPKDYLPDNVDVKYTHQVHDSWVNGTNSKFSNILSLENCDSDYLIYFDADTSVSKDFTEDWFIGDTVGLEHFGNNGWMKEVKGYDRNPASKAYVPHDTPLFQMYYHGCLFGGEKNKIWKCVEYFMLINWKIKRFHTNQGLTMRVILTSITTIIPQPLQYI